MIVKNIEFDKDRLLVGISKIAAAVGSTMGPMGRTVLLESENHVGGVTVTKDGVTVARGITLEDPVENLAVTLMKQAADRTAVSAGDGTTTSIVLTYAIIDTFIASGREAVASEMRAIKKSSEEIIEKLREMAVPVTDETLLHVATISANGDTEIGQLVSDVFMKVGASGVVTVERSNTSKTYFEISEGMRINRGWTSPYFITDQKKREAVLDNPYVLVTDREIQSIQSIEHILAPLVRDGKSILIIGEMNTHALNALNMNVAKGTIKAAAVVPPQFGYKRRELMADIANAVGAKYISDEVGDDFGLVSIADLGRVSKAVVGKDSTVMVMSDNSLAKNRASELLSMEAPVDEEEKKFLAERIATLNGSVGVVYVGAQTDIEQKEKYDRVDDAVSATKAAIEEGILPGGGYALLKVSEGMPEDEVMTNAVTIPFYTILENAGFDEDMIQTVCDEFDSNGRSFNPVSQEFGDMMEMGIVDPLKVTRSAIENAVSVATTILSTQAIIYNMREHESSK
jgi:chaperonin GroEL